MSAETRAWWLVGIALVLAGVWLRWYQLDLQIVLDDEWHALHKLLASDAHAIRRTFGFADHSIPLTLWYHWRALHGGLDEWTLRAPAFLASCALLVLLPWLVRREASAGGIAIGVGLIAVSPLQVHFAKLARPYALTALLGVIAVLACHRYWHAGDRRQAWAWGGAYVGCAFLAGWLHTVTLPFVLAPCVVFGARALAAAWRRDPRPLARLAAVAMPLAALLAWALIPPLVNDWNAVSAKSGKDAVTFDSAWRTGLMLAGTREGWLLVALSALSAFGVRVLHRRSPGFTRYVSFCCGLLALAVALSGAMYIHHPLVFARYLLPALPLLCWFAGEGAADLLRGALGRWRRAGGATVASAAAAVAPAALGGLAVAMIGLRGPLPEFLYYPNQFIGHLKFQFDYDPVANPYVRLAAGLPIPGFYGELAKRPPMSTTLVEMPWRLESHYNPLPWYQAEHRQRVKIGMVGGVCGERTWGEYFYRDRRLKLDNFIHLASILADEPIDAEYLVVHRRPWSVDRDPAVEWPDMARCLPAIVAHLGAPVSDDGDVAVFRLGRRTDIGR